ncbi:MAG: Gfo/Idh/MocA family oxidoreductase [Anaerolineae bacterium]|nr:Gfo/Idh/MocA family oxidoreductase [Anaerolineae bacterium]
MMEENVTGIAIFGCGYWGINYVRVFEELCRSRVVAICDLSLERLQEVGRRFPRIKLTTDIEEALNTAGVDAAVICTQASTHYELAHRCLMAGKPVLVEKPITTTISDAEALLKLAESRKLTLMVGHTFVHNAGVKKVKEYIDQARIGQIYYLYAQRTNLGPIRQDVNALWDLAPHDVSIFNYLLGSAPEWVSAVGVNALQNQREDVGFISLGYPDGVVGHIHVSWADPNKVRQVVVVGSEQRIVFDDLNTLEQVRVYEKGVAPASPEATSYGEYHFLMREGDIISPRVEVSEPLKNQCRHFLDCVTYGHQPVTDGQTGMDVVRVMRAIDRSLKQQGTPVSTLPSLDPVVYQNGKHKQNGTHHNLEENLHYQI